MAGTEKVVIVIDDDSDASVPANDDDDDTEDDDAKSTVSAVLAPLVDTSNDAKIAARLGKRDGLRASPAKPATAPSATITYFTEREVMKPTSKQSIVPQPYISLPCSIYGLNPPFKARLKSYKRVGESKFEILCAPIDDSGLTSADKAEYEPRELVKSYRAGFERATSKPVGTSNASLYFARTSSVPPDLWFKSITQSRAAIYERIVAENATPTVEQKNKPVKKSAKSSTTTKTPVKPVRPATAPAASAATVSSNGSSAAAAAAGAGGSLDHKRSTPTKSQRSTPKMSPTKAKSPSKPSPLKRQRSDDDDTGKYPEDVISSPDASTTVQVEAIDREIEELIGSMAGRLGRLRITSGRQRQEKFRAGVVAYYGKKCALTKCPVQAVLECAHIVDYSYDNHLQPSNSNPFNGIYLERGMHSLWDKDVISFIPDEKSGQWTVSVHTSQLVADIAWVGVLRSTLWKTHLPFKVPVESVPFLFARLACRSAPDEVEGYLSSALKVKNAPVDPADRKHWEAKVEAIKAGQAKPAKGSRITVAQRLEETAAASSSSSAGAGGTPRVRTPASQPSRAVDVDVKSPSPSRVSRAADVTTFEDGDNDAIHTIQKHVAIAIEDDEKAFATKLRTLKANVRSFEARIRARVAAESNATIRPGVTTDAPAVAPGCSSALATEPSPQVPPTSFVIPAAAATDPTRAARPVVSVDVEPVPNNAVVVAIVPSILPRVPPAVSIPSAVDSSLAPMSNSPVFVDAKVGPAPAPPRAEPVLPGNLLFRADSKSKADEPIKRRPPTTAADVGPPRHPPITAPRTLPDAASLSGLGIPDLNSFAHEFLVYGSFAIKCFEQPSDKELLAVINKLELTAGAPWNDSAKYLTAYCYQRLAASVDPKARDQAYGLYASISDRHAIAGYELARSFRRADFWKVLLHDSRFAAIARVEVDVQAAKERATTSLNQPPAVPNIISPSRLKTPPF